MSINQNQFLPDQFTLTGLLNVSFIIYINFINANIKIKNGKAHIKNQQTTYYTVTDKLEMIAKRGFKQDVFNFLLCG